MAPLDGDAGLGGIAFFRDLSETQGIDAGTSAEAHRQFLMDYSELGDTEIRSLAEAALELYQTFQARSFSLEALQMLVGKGLSTKAIDSGVIVEAGSLRAFRHHLIHDFLASAALASRPDRWSQTYFDAVTLRASSFDALTMALEQLTNPGEADRLLRSIYDWNPYAAAYALSDQIGRSPASVSSEMKVALLAMLGEKRFDLIKATSLQASDALALFSGSDLQIASRLSAANELDEVFEIVREAVAADPTLKLWGRFFLASGSSDLTDSIIDSLKSLDSLTGWTAANALKRVTLSKVQQAQIREELKDDNSVVRWRAAHSLGAHPTTENVRALENRLDDAHYWVRYGVVRSLIEAAARDVAVRSEVFAKLAQTIEDTDEAGVAGELVKQLRRDIVLREIPSGWLNAVTPIVEAQFARAMTRTEQDLWRLTAGQLVAAVEDSTE
jgi:HEAT repeat protein